MAELFPTVDEAGRFLSAKVRGFLAGQFPSRTEVLDLVTAEPVEVTDARVEQVLTDPSSAAAASLSATIGAQVPPAVVTALAADPTPKQAAAAAVDTELANKQIIRGRGEIGTGADANTYVGTAFAGLHLLRSATVADTVVNFPVKFPGLLYVGATKGSVDSSLTYQLFVAYGSQAGYYWRVVVNAAGTSWTPWRKVADDATVAALSTTVNAFPNTYLQQKYAHVGVRNEILRGKFVQRRGGNIGTGGKPVVALRFDHDLNNFATKVLPLLRQYGLPSSLCVMSRMFIDANGITRNNNHTWSDVQSWALNDAVEIWNHGATHRDAQTPAELEAEIAAPLATYRTEMPKVAVEGYMIPGISTAAGVTALGGFGNGNTPEAFYDTLAGRMILAHHAVSMGYQATTYRPLDGQITQGMNHLTIDEMSYADGAVTSVQAAQGFGAGLCLMLHPSLIDAAAENITSAKLAEILAFIAAERDAGRLEVMTVSGLTLADAGSSYRFNLLENPVPSAATDGWAGKAGWTFNGATASGTTTAGLLTRAQSITRLLWAAGAVWEFSAEFTAGATDVTVRVRVEDSSTPGNVGNQREVTIPAGQTRRVRTHITIPVTGTTGLRYFAGRVSGGTVTLTGLRMVAA